MTLRTLMMPRTTTLRSLFLFPEPDNSLDSLILSQTPHFRTIVQTSKPLSSYTRAPENPVETHPILLWTRIYCESSNPKTYFRHHFYATGN